MHTNGTIMKSLTFCEFPEISLTLTAVEFPDTSRFRDKRSPYSKDECCSCYMTMHGYCGACYHGSSGAHICTKTPAPTTFQYNLNCCYALENGGVSFVKLLSSQICGCDAFSYTTPLSLNKWEHCKFADVTNTFTVKFSYNYIILTHLPKTQNKT